MPPTYNMAKRKDLITVAVLGIALGIAISLFVFSSVDNDSYEVVTPGFEALEAVKCINSIGESMDFPDNACHIYGTPKNLSVGDVIVYEKGNHSVIHRIDKIEDINETIYYTTKGDNNYKADKPITLENITYKVLKTIYFGD